MTMRFVDPAALTRPVYLSFAEQIGRAIRDGTLTQGARLPPHRTLAERLKISVQTVSRAYDELIRRGLLVGGGAPSCAPRTRRARCPYQPERLGEVIDLSILKPICETMHVERMRRALVGLAETLPPSAVLSFLPNVIFPRRRAVAVDWLKQCGLSVPASNICLTNGATAGMTTALLSTAPAGTTVATEAVGCHTLLPLAAYLGLKLAAIEIDEDGIVPVAPNLSPGISTSVAWHEGFLREAAIAIELLLKAAIWLRIEAGERSLAVPLTHNLPQLWSEAGLRKPSDAETLHHLETPRVLAWSGRYPTLRTRTKKRPMYRPSTPTRNISSWLH